ncbi:DUF1993 domain-containing protein [Parachitinimonas caeni]|uniref:DUF1993 domain-containing protein n=1 Tax=Parachitinimonas caeni TaxID=3031301 RepID=A0ABT7DZZ5_9NEIS|nr:DUF1993 domain-containing protein [Parachitinimonas caeni]MDK2125409.1 DUF1993 domain-containing protein [Parachitinimonas caeni]
MSLSMYQVSVAVMPHFLNSLSVILDKAVAHADAKKFDMAVLLGSRLAPDMFPLSRQIQIASDLAKGCAARLAGVEPPNWEDNETTVEELKARIAKTVDYLQTFKPEQIDGSESRTVVLKMRSGELTFDGLTYLNQFVLPNFYFHLTTAYDILRHNGVELGKKDFLGAK